MVEPTNYDRYVESVVRPRDPSRFDWRSIRMWTLVALCSVLAVGIYWARPSILSSPPPLPSHSHNDPGNQGGILVPVGHEHFHVEALFSDSGGLKIFTLGQDQTLVFPVPKQTLTAYLRSSVKSDAVRITLEATPQPGDPAGQTSAFDGQLPQELVGTPLLVLVPEINFGAYRYRFAFFARSTGKGEMPPGPAGEK